MLDQIAGESLGLILLAVESCRRGHQVMCNVAFTRIWTLLSVLIGAAGFLLSPEQVVQGAEPELAIPALFQRTCVSCHGPEKQEGGLRLDSARLALRGGDSGPVIVPAKAESSELLRRIQSEDPNDRMPPKGPPLSAAEIKSVQAWIEAGAVWPEGDSAADSTDDPRRQHWAWQPLSVVEPPAVSRPEWVRNPIDRFIQAKLDQLKLTPSAEADRRVLIRRLSFDLIGLPPAPDEVTRFVTDPRPDAYERLVDRLLESPRYGERWARHWLDVVHYGDTHGYDKDKPRPNAWPYRDYVIRAFNEDKPYARFIREQLAGDILYPGNRDGIIAMGLIAAGPWDFIGHAEVPETKIDGKIARHLDRDDMVGNTIGTFCSVTIQCAQCHHHKFDPFTQDDYYALQSVFAALDRADRPYYDDPFVGQRALQLAAMKSALERQLAMKESQVRELGGRELAELDEKLQAASRPTNTVPPEYGYHSAIASSQDQPQWVQVDLGSAQPLTEIVLRPCYDDFNQIGAGFGFPVRFRLELSDDPEFRAGVAVVYRAEQDVPNPGLQPQRFPVHGMSGRYLRITATKLAPRLNDYIFAVSEVEALTPAGANIARGKPVTALESIEAPIRWGKKNLVDGLFPLAPESATVATLTAQREMLLMHVVPAELRSAVAETRTQLEQVNRELKTLPTPQFVYAGTIHSGAGPFVGTGPTGGRPRPIHVLSRGNVLTPSRPAVPGAINAFTALPGRFNLAEGHAEGERRVALAEWIVHPENPLTWRSAVNRVWQYHFGRGLVETANDFGRMGAAPTHPELLDWLAREFRDRGGSLKQLHRLIVTSSTYRQVANNERAEASAMDGDNRFLWRQNRRKLEAEAVRDALFAVSGTLDWTMGGPGFQDFVVEHPEHSPHYEYHLADPEDRRLWRRSVYRFLVRSKTEPFMTSLDCADPSMRVEKRNESLSAAQALALLNNGIVLTQAKHFAERVRRQAGSEPRKQVRVAVELAFSRPPEAEESAVLEEFLGTHGLENLCRLLFNANEFAFVD